MRLWEDNLCTHVAVSKERERALYKSLQMNASCTASVKHIQYYGHGHLVIVFFINYFSLHFVYRIHFWI